MLASPEVCQSDLFSNASSPNASRPDGPPPGQVWCDSAVRCCQIVQETATLQGNMASRRCRDAPAKRVYIGGSGRGDLSRGATAVGAGSDGGTGAPGGWLRGIEVQPVANLAGNG